MTSDLLVLPTFNASRSVFSIIEPLGMGGGEMTEQAEARNPIERTEFRSSFLPVSLLKEKKSFLVGKMGDFLLKQDGIINI